jgi:hypothetical protein
MENAFRMKFLTFPIMENAFVYDLREVICGSAEFTCLSPNLFNLH